MKPAIPLLVTVSVALAGCALAPPASPPALPMPAAYVADLASSSPIGTPGTLQQVVPGERPVTDWWRAFGSDKLNAWVDEGLKNNPSLEAARHTLEAVRQQYRATVGDNLLPSLDAQGQVSRQRALGLPEFGPPTNLYNVYAGQLSLNYNFDVFGAARYGVKQARAQVDVQSYQLEAVRRALAANIVIAAINASAAAEQVDAAARLAQLAHAQADLADRAYALGAASHDDALTARQNAANADAALPGLRAQALKARHALAVYMGRTPDRAPDPLPLSQWQWPAAIPLSVPSDLLEQRPDVQVAAASLRAASAQVGIATANMFPHIALSASTGSAAFKDSALFGAGSGIWSAGLSLAQPIFHGGALRAQRKAAVAEYEASVAQYRQTVLNAFQNVADTLVALEQDAEAWYAAHEAASLAHESFDQTQGRYRLGAVPYVLQLSSEQRWENARLAEIQATAARLVDTAALFHSMGEPPRNLGQAHESIQAVSGR
ncbi:MAG TPA: efflux transporter outer membrane subunit [Dyella sp.]|uniref:efflux transporter outer membrane subunit n=1 Tax=Dyella sp. TaxID=1869338 RepID=UPI002F9541E1